MALLKKRKDPKSRGRGAVKKQSQSRRFQFPKINLKPLFFGAISLMLISGAAVLFDVLKDRPINRVLVEGSFEFVERPEIIRQVQPFLERGFFFLDIEDLRAELESLPWVHRVAVERQWPDEMNIHVTEQTVFARWGNDGYLNQQGELFLDKNRNELSQLPLLSGPDGSEHQVAKQYSYLSARFLEKNLKLEKLSLSSSGLWTATLGEKVVVAFGVEDISEKMDRLLVALDVSIGSRLAQIKRIDMRYSNGLAVQWDQAKAQL